MSEPYDPYVPRAGEEAHSQGEEAHSQEAPAGQSQPGSSKMADIQLALDDTTGIMKANIKKVADRGERLDSLQDKTDALATSAQGFRRGANRVRKNMWWKDMKMRIIIGTAITVILIIIIVSVVRATKH